MQELRGPVGFRMALNHPDRSRLHRPGTLWRKRRPGVSKLEGTGAFWADRVRNESTLRQSAVRLADDAAAT